MELTLSECWAKADKSGQPILSIKDHSIHVGSVGKELIAQLPKKLQELVPRGGVLLIAAHDIGKISPGFLLKSPFWQKQWQKHLGLDASQCYESSHAKVSHKFFADQYKNPPRWLMALSGHHGTYLSANARPAIDKLIGDARFQDLRSELLNELKKHFGDLSDEEKIEKGPRLHWFTGLMIFSDWLGSNPTWFPPHRPPESPEEAARKAIQDIGWGLHFVKPNASFYDLFGLKDPRPLQQRIYQIADSPGLYIVEAPMGMGKTEAALFTAYCRWTLGHERGLYFALPTQLTSVRIHDRVQKFLAQAVENWSTITLVHGNAWLTDKRIQAIPPTSANNNADTPDPSTDGNRWFSDNRRALLAPFGVGTADQALMAVLPVKFSALRMFALGGKVVVIDEVHSYDPYTSAIIDRAVEWLLELHCTIIILSATLTTARRQSLLKAAKATNPITTHAYPLITKVATGSGCAEVFEFPSTDHPQKKVTVHCVSATSNDWIQQVAEAAHNRACVLVIRNTVALAQQTYDELKAECRDTGILFGLVHSRFTQADREKNEGRWVELLGKDQGKRPPNGAILVGTQVLEQSVDIDADLLVTDLAPVDLILQRIGRLHRHERSRPEGCKEARCLIICPQVNWEADAKTIKDQLQPHCYIYPPFSLYMAHRILSQRKELCIPTEIRKVLEESAKEPSDMPAGMAELHQEFSNTIQMQLNTALRLGPFSEVAVDDIEGAETRWGFKPTGYIVLVKSPPGVHAKEVTLHFPCGEEYKFSVGIFDFALAKLLHKHAIQLPRYLIQDFFSTAPSWLKQHFPHAILAVLDDTDCLTPYPTTQQASFSFKYSSDKGLIYHRTAHSSATDEDAEPWF